MEKKDYLGRGHSVITFAIRGRGFHQNTNVCKQREDGGVHINANVYIYFF